jgi:antitoxin ParD1/3/4
LNTLKLSLTDELQAFIDDNSGEGTLYATPGEFVRSVLREKKERLEAAKIRSAILEGYQDAFQGRITEYRGNLQTLIHRYPRARRR